MGLFWLSTQVWAHMELDNKFPPTFLGGTPPLRCFLHVFDLPIKAVKTPRRGGIGFVPFIPQMLQNSSWKGKKKVVLSSNGFFCFEEMIYITGRPAANNPLCFPAKEWVYSILSSIFSDLSALAYLNIWRKNILIPSSPSCNIHGPPQPWSLTG